MRLQVQFIFISICFLLACKNDDPHKNPSDDKNYTAISFITPDSINIFGELYENDKTEDVILLFHQGGSNTRGEYRTIIPELLKTGVNILAIDQRVGGQIYGSYNRTIANIPGNSFNNNYGYCDAYNNLEGALDFIMSNDFTGKRILWGSSYSASLVMKLASERPNDVNGVLAFSPAAGKVMEGCNPEEYIEKISIPLIILKPPNEMESERSKAQFELAEKYNHQTYAAEYGVHGSSMLVASRVGNDVSKNWEVVLDFLKLIRS